MIIAFDPDADAIYVRLPEQALDFGETDVDDEGVIIDTYADGSPRGYEFLAVSVHGVDYSTLPQEIDRALRGFVDAGHLKSPIYIEAPA